MNFLAPVFLAGLALIAAPVIAHLIRRATRERFAFSSLRFLDESPPRLDRRSRIQHPWLLLLRSLVVAVLALAFSRPYWSDGDTPAAAAGVARHVVVVLDTSASMQRDGLWEAALARVEAIVGDTRPLDQLALAAVSVDTRWLISAERWRATPHGERQALVQAALTSLTPGWQSIHLDTAAHAALLEWERMAEADNAAGRGELVIVSDFAAGTRTAGLGEIDWPAGTRVDLAPVAATDTGNASLEWLGWTTAAASASVPAGTPAARFRISRSFDLADDVSLHATNPITGARIDLVPQLDLLPGGTRILTVPWPDPELEAVRVELEVDDAAPFDNSLWIARPPVRHIRLTYLGRHDTADPQQTPFYLARAAGGILEPVVEFEVSAAPTPAGSGVWVIDGPLPVGTADAARRHIEAGGTVLWLDPATPEADEWRDSLERVSGVPGWHALTPARDDALFGEINFRHPLFAPFSDARFSDFTRIRFWNPRPIQAPEDSPIQVVARFDDETPAVIEQIIGEGRLILWCGGWAPADGQWVLSSKFVPWLAALVERAAGGTRQASVTDVDRPHRVLSRDSSDLRRIDGPAATSFAADADPAGPLDPGIYSIDTAGEQRYVALNVPSAESQLEPLPLDIWEQLGVPLAEESVALGVDDRGASQQEARAIEGRQQFWRGLLWAAVGILAIESLVSIWLSRGARSLGAPVRT